MSKEAVIESEDKSYEVEVADNLLSRAWGLSFRTEGRMLFKFSNPTKARIDMMLLSEPLWLYFLDGQKQVIDIQKAEPWSANPKTWKLYSPDRKYRYLIESFDELEIQEGDNLSFS